MRPQFAVTESSLRLMDLDGEQLYLFHCHVLEHEDQGMMLNFKVVPGDA